MMYHPRIYRSIVVYTQLPNIYMVLKSTQGIHIHSLVYLSAILVFRDLDMIPTHALNDSVCNQRS